MNKFLNFTGLTALFNKLVEKFTPVLEEVSDVEADTEYYVTNVDYDLIKFDTSELLSDIIAFDGTVTALYGSVDFGGVVFSNVMHFSLDANILPFNLKACKIAIDGVKYSLSSTNVSASQQAMLLINSANAADGTPWLISNVTSSNTYIFLDKTVIEEGSEHQLKITYNPKDLVTV